MHNLSNEYFQNEFNTNEYGNELSPEFEFNNENIGESQYELSPEFTFESQGYEMNEGELIQELMEVTNETEFGSWLKNLGKKAAGMASGFLNSPTGQQATALLGNIAKRTLPGLGSRAGGWVGGRLGGIVGQSNYGRKIGQRFGSRAGQSAADYYPDFVKFASDALSNMSQEFEAGIQPQVKPAIIGAAKKYYPIILKVKGTLQARQLQNNNTNEMEFNNEFAGETFGEANYEMQGEITSNEGTFSEVTEMELASELLSIQSEAELDKFFGGLFKKAVGAVKNFAKSSTGKALGGMLKGLAKKALPLAGKALGTFIAPGIGTALGGALGSAASKLFELELEGLSPEDREFETARAFVRFAGNSARRASRMNTNNPYAAAKTALLNSAGRYAPGLLARRSANIYNNGYGNDAGGVDTATDGTWYKDGGRIILTGNI